MEQEFEGCGITSQKHMEAEDLCPKCGKAVLEREMNYNTMKQTVVGCPSCGNGWRMK